MTQNAHLTSSQADQLLIQYGKNEVAATKFDWINILLNQLKSTIVYLLLASIVISLAVGDITSLVVILALVIVNTIIGFRQEFTSNLLLQNLQSYLSAKASVIRYGELQLIETKLLVPGDIIILKMATLFQLIV